MRNFILLFFTILAVNCFSQTSKSDTTLWFVNDSVKGGGLSINMDKKLAQMMKGKEKLVCNKTIYNPPKKLTPADKCATQQKIMGYKIQIFYTKDRDAANQMKNDFSRQFPGLTPELIYASPDYRILVGDYFTRQSASSDLRRIQRTYPGAFPVQWRVWCRKAL